MVVVEVEVTDDAGVSVAREPPAMVIGVAEATATVEPEATDSDAVDACSARVVGGTNSRASAVFDPDRIPPRSVEMPPVSPGSANAPSKTTTRPTEPTVATKRTRVRNILGKSPLVLPRRARGHSH